MSTAEREVDADGVIRGVIRMTAFAETADGGNPAGVVLDASGLDDAAMLRIAREVGFSETAFVVGEPGAAGEQPRRYAVRYFSPGAEVPFCGHATVATAAVLAEHDGAGAMVFETRAGDVGVASTSTPDGEIEIAMTSVEPTVRELSPEVLATLLELLGLTETDLDPRLPAREAFAGNWHPIITLADQRTFDAFTFDPAPVAALMAEQGWAGTVTVQHELEPGLFGARNLFPVGAITEDPATGSAAAATGAYLREIGYAEQHPRVTIRQGAHVGRPSRLDVTIPAAGGITVTGRATRMD